MKQRETRVETDGEARLKEVLNLGKSMELCWTTEGQISSFAITIHSIKHSQYINW